MSHEYLERVVDLTDPENNQILNMSLEGARACVLACDGDRVKGIDGSFALLAKDGKTVRMARSMDRPMRYFLAKRKEGPALIVADRIDTIFDWLKSEGLDDQFHPSYTRMVPAHHIVEILLIGCPDPDPNYTRFFTPERNRHPQNIEAIGEAYISALRSEVAKWLSSVPTDEPIGVCFSGGIDSGAVFVTVYETMRKLGMSLSRLKAFTLSLGDGADLGQAREFLDRLKLGLFLESIESDLSDIDVSETIRIVEDYKLLDVECASMGLALCRGIRERYPDWKFLVDGDGGDENLKDYPIEENPELTIRSVVNNLMLYQEGWGVGKFKHSQTYSGGLSRSYTRTYAPLKKYAFNGFSPFTRPAVIEAAEGIPFIDLTDYDVPTLYSLKGKVVSAGMKRVFGIDFPTFEKRRFQHGAVSEETLRTKFPVTESTYRKSFLALYDQ